MKVRVMHHTMMTSRDAILQRIRTELAKGPHVELPPVSEVWPRTNPSQTQLGERFAKELQTVQGELVRCASMEEAKHKLKDLMAEHGWDSVGAVNHPLCRDLASALPTHQVVWTRDGWDANDMARLSAGLVAADYLVADSGSCMVTCNTAEERLMCYLPPACVVVGKTEQLVEHLPAFWCEVARQAADVNRRGEFVLITGPSRTADIEKILILGVHGPKRLFVLLVG